MICNRLLGYSAADCFCRIPGGGWLPCPPEARGILTPAPGATIVPQPPLATGSGYTGDECPDCGGLRMRRNGTCTLCEDCGATTGCS